MKPSLAWPPCRTDALQRLQAFVPKSGRSYAALRNYVPEYQQLQSNESVKPSPVSRLSPYLRHRILLEHEVALAVLNAHGPSQGQKFLQELLWRSYWKGYLQQRPQIWRDYLTGCEHAQRGLNLEQGELYRRAVQAQTGLTCFDAWASELIQSGYLHNHARMWFASIWIFTLRLPWQLGAQFFLDHLLDGCPASNTLSWRWVAGLHTQGKHYVARADNIAKYTDGRFAPYGELNERAQALPLDKAYQSEPVTFALSEPVSGGKDNEALLLVTEDDLYLQEFPLPWHQIGEVVLVRSDWSRLSAPVAEFKASAFEGGATHLSRQLGRPVEVIDANQLTQKIIATGSNRVIHCQQGVGPALDGVGAPLSQLQQHGVEIIGQWRDWDRVLWLLEKGAAQTG
ncbi:FAD-binding domain-containing protein [Ferrimonas aestuarii]|uniref:Cryptochrome/DNA photolyase FAD-binding domain-containing protein n=1 Tax=Ferrimonas aestuarii TaxID=2569539 RepID=A0A4U1BVI9_9GAMM|nr:FAD-binding domain-containing protein [Ferrimonas aestuarii]TKB58621.1 hypothetical protein FCL42_02415 [Ferrimonas aestuarii]